MPLHVLGRVAPAVFSHLTMGASSHLLQILADLPSTRSYGRATLNT